MKMTDLGMPYDSGCCAPTSAPDSKKPSYPTLYINSKEELDLPDAGTVVIKFRKTRETEDKKDQGKPTYSCELEVQSIGEPVASEEGMVSVADAIKVAMRKKLGKAGVGEDE